MSIIESVLYKLGRSNGQYQRGIADAFSLTGARPSASDPTAWIDPLFWGEGLARSRKPGNKKAYVASYQGWVYISVRHNAQARAGVPLRLFVAKEEKGFKFRYIKVKPVDKRKLRYLESQSNLESILTKAQEVEEVTEHAFLDLKNSVNPYHNSRDLIEYTSMFSDLTGESYWWMPSLPDQESGKKIPQEIWTIPSQYINPIFGETLDNAITGYLYKRGNVEVTLPADEVVLFTCPNPHNVFTGFSTIRGIADAVYIQSQMNEFETSLFENRARPGGIFSTDEQISKADMRRLKESFGQKHVGSDKAGKDVFLPRGFKYNRDAMTPTELNFIDGRKQNRIEIMAAFGVPEALLINEGSNRASTDGAIFIHAKNTIQPWLDSVAQKINERIMPLYGGDGNKLFVAFDNSIPEDRELKLKEDDTNVKNGTATVNEIRAERGDELVEGGDEPLVDGRLVQLAGLGADSGDDVEEVFQLALQRLRDAGGDSS